MRAETGRVDYSERAFHQDAHDAMRGDIIRALIETITNSDDAYGESDGKIRLEIEHRRGPWKVISRDRAKGMTAARMKSAITQLGGRTSGFEGGERVRGNLGRGAKDLAAFGIVTFESICDGYCAKLTLNPTGQWDLDRERTARQDDRDRLHIPKNGTVVTINVDENHRCSQHSKLAEKLPKHVQLRDILSDPRREVQLVDLGKGTTNILRYTQPDLPVLFSGRLPIEGYPDAIAEVSIHRNPERYEDPQSDSYRPGGLLLTGRRAIYESTLFRFENNPHAGWFSGRVRCEYIDKLAMDYDQRLVEHKPQNQLNSMPIICRHRDGLQRSHPFYKALALAVEQPLGELVAAEEKMSREQTARESPELRRSLDALGRELARLIDEDLRELDEEGLRGAGGSDKQPLPLRLVPEDVVVYAGEDKTITLLVRGDLSNGQPLVELDPEGVVELIDGPTVPLSVHKTRPDILTGQIRVRPLVEGEQTILTATCSGHSTAAVLEVRPERVVDEIPIPAPDTLQFERDRYQLAWMKKKSIRVLAPVELVAEEGTNLRVESSDAGVVVLGKGTSLELDEDVEYYAAEITIEARKLGARATVRAQLGTTTAACAVVVAREEGGPNLRIQLDPMPAGNFRALVERKGDLTLIKIMAEHSGIKRYLGAGPKYPYQNLSASKVIVAEIVAGEAARMVMERKFPLHSGVEQLDAARLYVEHNRYLAKYLARCHKALVPEAGLRLMPFGN